MYGRLSRPQNYSRSLLPSFLTAPLFPASVCLKRLSDHSKVPTPAKTCPSRGRNSIKVSVDFPYSRSLTDARPNPSYAYAQQIKTDLCVRPAAPRVPVRTQRRTQKGISGRCTALQMRDTRSRRIVYPMCGILTEYIADTDQVVYNDHGRRPSDQYVSLSSRPRCVQRPAIPVPSRTVC